MSDRDLWTRIREARLFRVLAVYLGASWILLQVTGQLRDALQLPRWVSPVTVILLLAGLVIILATAWVQSHPGVAARAAAEEVPDRWELDLGEMAGSIAKGRMPHLTWARTLLGGAAAFLLLFGFAGLYVVVQDRGRSFVPPPAMAGEAAPGLAVLPFSVQGESLDSWREGMISLLSTDLDGAAGMRAIDGRTVLARWREKVRDGGAADLATSLAVARAAGARDAVIGSAVVIGSGVRVSADIYDVTSGSKLGSARVEGDADSIFNLVDRLAVQVLTALPRPGGGAVPQVDLARVTTSSVPALRAFLDGEDLYRRSQFDAAAVSYRKAVEADSTFAFAWYRLAFCYGWTQSVSSESESDAAARAARFSDRLPERERTLVLASRELDEGDSGGLSRMRQAVRRYPDDAEAWYLLGEMQEHLGDQTLVPDFYDSADVSFGRAVALDSAFGPGYLHPIDNAFTRVDSTAAAPLVAAYGRHFSGSVWDRANRISYGLMFGDSADRGAALAALDTADAATIRAAVNGTRFTLPRQREAAAAAFRHMGGSAKAPASVVWARFLTLYQSGQADSALALAETGPVHEYTGDGGPYAFFASRGVPVPASALRNLAGPRGEEEAPETDFFRGALAADSGRWAAVDSARERLARAASASRTGGDSVSADFYEGAARALQGYRDWKRGRSDSALAAFQDAGDLATGYGPRYAANSLLRWWTGELLLEMGRPADAEPYFASLWQPRYGWDPYAALELGKTYTELGEPAKAHTAYRWIVDGWKDADPSLQPRVEEARQALAKLGT